MAEEIKPKQYMVLYFRIKNDQNPIPWGGPFDTYEEADTYRLETQQSCVFGELRVESVTQ